ncbi:hypothetical protein BH10PLA1_BH10PLA1_17350 [soil metagenome]
MSRTLFRYIFWDLLRIFLMTNGALSGIMSFAGLLRPLTQNGLDAGQVGRLLAYFTPSMMAYSFPIAALFSATVVYGRMNSDSEILACRAGGISHFAIALPGIVLGMVVAMVSLLFLCFIVPAFTLKVEKVMFSNVSQFVANKIERNHQIKFGTSTTVFAQRAEAIPPDPAEPNVQRVVLEGPTIITYDKPDRNNAGLRIPDEFWMANKATLHIRTDANGDNAQMTAALDGGMKFPRRAIAGWEGGVSQTQFGPMPFGSFLKEDTKFMDITRLKELEADKSKSKKINDLKKQFVEDDQEDLYLKQVEDGLKSPQRSYVFRAGADVYYVSVAGGEQIERKGVRLVIDSASAAGRTVHVAQERNGVPTLDATAGELRIRARPDPTGENINVTLELSNLLLHEPEGDVSRATISQAFSVTMPTALRALNNATPQAYGSSDPNAPDTRHRMMREIIVLRNDIASEMHTRAAFAFSCLVLTVIGCTLGMMFKSGNFLSAFALSFLPAMFCITLIIAGQRTCGNIPFKFWLFTDPLRLGLSIIWSGNAIVSVVAVGLLWRLQRQ